MISKSELKKRQKAREKEAKKSTQAAAQAQTAGPAQPSFKDATASEKDLTPNQVRP
jgi:lysyl-tRNA synthetase class 2